MAIADLAVAVGARLSTQWPFVLTTVLALVGAWLLPTFFKSDPLATIPEVGKGSGDVAKRRELYKQNARELYQEGYEKVKNGLGVYRMLGPRVGEIIVVHPRFLPELKNLPDDVLNFAEAFHENFHADYTKARADRPIVPLVLKKDLNSGLTRLNPTIAQEVRLCLQTELPPCKDFTPVTLGDHLARIVAQASGRIFVGEELCRTEEYLDMSINYTLYLMEAAHAINALRPEERAAKAKGLKAVKALKAMEERGQAMLQPLIDARRKAMKEDPHYKGPDDIMQWILDTQARTGELSSEELTATQLSLTFAAIHTTTQTAANAFLTLAAMPELVPEIREEIRAVLKEHGTFTTAALAGMKKFDSFMRENNRVFPLIYASFTRKVMKPITLSNGQHIPAGTVLETPSVCSMNDPDLVPNASEFDPWRSYRLREDPALSGTERASVAAANLMVTVSQSSLTFGYGRHACPGRFFAANEVKMLLGAAILEYDWKNIDGSRERYPNLSIAEFNVPDTTKPLLFKRLAPVE